MRRKLASTLFVVLAVMAAAPTTLVAQDEPEKIVVIGDVHGDYNNFVQVLQDTGIVDRRLRWQAGKSRLVQLGDVSDRGPDTRKIVELLTKLARQASRRKGAVYVLIGNHEAMNMQGDLRYVHPGEYAAFIDRDSERRRDRYYEISIEHIKSHTPEEEWPVFDAAHREEWNKRFPLGYVEHRLAWAPTGEIGKWVLENHTVLVLDGTLFVHAGLTSDYASYSASDINTRVRTELAAPERLGDDAIVNVPDGPLWTRNASASAETAAQLANIQRVLDAFGAKRMVVGHTPSLGTVFPRFGGRVIVADVGLSSYYGGSLAALEIDGDTLTLIHNGERIPLPTDDAGVEEYLQQVKPLVPEPARIDNYLESRAADAAAEAAAKAAAEVAAEIDEVAEDAAAAEQQ